MRSPGFLKRGCLRAADDGILRFFFFLLIFCCLLLPRWSSLPSRNGGGYFWVRVYWFGIILLEFSQDEFIRFISGGDFFARVLHRFSKQDELRFRVYSSSFGRDYYMTAAVIIARLTTCQ